MDAAKSEVRVANAEGGGWIPRLERWLSRNRERGEIDPLAVHVTPEEIRKSERQGTSPGSAWRAFIGWLIGLPRLPPVVAPDPPPTPPNLYTPVIGICCSGGGIRSAAYNLGALQTLHEEGELQRARYLSAVSGGGYTACSYAVMTARTEASLLDEVGAYAPESPEAAYLLNHSSYLGPPGIWGKLWMVARTLLGLVVNVGFFAAILFLIGWPLGWWYRGLHPGLATEPSLTVEPWMILASAVPAGIGALMVVGDLLANLHEHTRRLLRAWYIRLIVVGLVMFTLLLGIPYLVELIRVIRLRSLPLGQLTLPTTGLAALLVGAAQALFARRRLLLARIAGALVGPLLLLFLLVLFARLSLFLSFDGQTGQLQPSSVWLWLSVLGGFLLFYLLADLTTWSPHPFYRRALWEAFGIRRAASDETGSAVVSRAEQIGFDEKVRLSQLPRGSGAPPGRSFPELIVCAAANVSDEGATPPGRAATTFTFTPGRIGGPMAREFAREDFESALGPQHARNLGVDAAMAISGAAISPSMGKMTHRSVRFLMALLNVRLGMWLPNPIRRQWWQRLATRSRVWQFLRGRARPWFLLKEMLGINHLNSKFLYVSDGGHYENLGLVELLRRGCTLIYCFDASGDSEDTFFTVADAIALARTELGVEITIRLEKMRPRKKGALAPRDVVLGDIRYPDGTPGVLVLGKAAVTAKAPPDVRMFKERDKRFPNHSTVDQFFNERKFEAYRALGRSTARRAVVEARKVRRLWWLQTLRSRIRVLGPA